MRRAPTLGLLLLLAACAAQPPVRERRVELELPERFGAARAEADAHAPADGNAHASVDAAPGAPWWQAFVAPELHPLVAEALAREPDVAAVAARLAAAGARLDATGAAARPSAELGLGRERFKRNFLGFPDLGPGGPGGGGGGADEPFTTRATIYSLSLDTSWEIDLFGRLGARTDAARADVQAARAELAGARLSLVGALLKALHAALEAEQQRALAARSLAAWERNEAILEGRFRAGLRTAFDARRVSARRAAAAAELAARERTARDTLRRVERLLGRAPVGRLELPDALPPAPPPAPPGLPAELLARRPDLAAAERRLLASERRVAASRAALYPRLSLTGSVGTSSEQVEDLLDGDFGVWNLGVNLVLPLFEGGRLRAEVRESEALATQALLEFSGALLDAVAEVEQALDGSHALVGELEAREQAAEDAERAVEVARDRYRRGVGDLLALLEAERTALLDASSALRVRRELLDARVDLHLALGGGFHADALEEEPTAVDDGPPEDAP